MTFRSTSDQTPDDDHVDVIRREERLVLGTERHATERIRLERVVVSEQRTITIDVSHEEIRLSREAITDGAPLPAGTTSPAPEPIVVVLREEQVIVAKTRVPVERVTLTTHTVVEDQVVRAALDHEEVDDDRSDA